MGAEKDATDGMGHLHVLSGVLRDFAEATSDYERLLDVVARTLARVVQDGCVIRLLSDDGCLSPAAVHLPVAHVCDLEALERFRAHVTTRCNISEEVGARRVIETGEALVVPNFDFNQLQDSASPEIVHAYKLVGIHSLMLVALRVSGQSLGLLALLRFDRGSPPYGEKDLELAQALADHAALALSNSRLLRATSLELAERKQAEAALRKTEEQLRNALKMEAVGRLAGGIAHDFNNLLTVILSCAELIADGLSPDELNEEIKQIEQAGLRAANLTKQLLAFSRQQVLDARVLDVNQNVARTETLLLRLLGATIELTILPANDLWNVKADSGQLDQIVMNLALNARDAMPDGGQLTIETANVQLDEEYAELHHGVLPGSYVLLAVTDTGAGMDRATQSRIFEPFFTTKELGKGTGLGLATVFGIVKQSGGHIWLYSELGSGTTFKVYFPRASGAVTEVVESVRPTPSSERGNETILLVEDDEQVRSVARGILRRQGYVVLDAPNGGEALLICEQHGAKIHLLLTDVVLPRMTGRQLAARLKPTRPEMKVLFMSGYADDAILQHGMLDSDVAYLEKPLTPGSLTRKVRAVLGGRSAA